MSTFNGTVCRLDLNNTAHADALIAILDDYSHDPMGNNGPLPDEVRKNLVPRLKQIDTFRGLLAVNDGQFVGLANCFTNALIFIFLTIAHFRADEIKNTLQMPDMRAL